MAWVQPTANKAAIHGQRPHPRPHEAHRMPDTTTRRSPAINAGMIQLGTVVAEAVWGVAG